MISTVPSKTASKTLATYASHVMCVLGSKSLAGGLALGTMETTSMNSDGLVPSMASLSRPLSFFSLSLFLSSLFILLSVYSLSSLSPFSATSD